MLVDLLPLALAAAQRSEAPASPDVGVADVVVTARPGPPPPLLDPVAYLRKLCFDPLRLLGRFALPEDDADWRPLSEEVGRAFGVADSGAPAFGLFDRGRGRTLLVKFERVPGRKGWNVVEDRCTLTVVGGRDHRRLRGDMDALFRASGTRRHVGERDGAPRLPGWDQWMWSGLPDRRSGIWRGLIAGGGGTESAWLVVFDPDFYDEYQYILGDLKTKADAARPVSVLTFARTYRVPPDEKGRPLAGPPLTSTPIP